MDWEPALQACLSVCRGRSERWHWLLGLLMSPSSSSSSPGSSRSWMVASLASPLSSSPPPDKRILILTPSGWLGFSARERRCYRNHHLPVYRPLEDSTTRLKQKGLHKESIHFPTIYPGQDSRGRGDYPKQHMAQGGGTSHISFKRFSRLQDPEQQEAP